MIRSALFSLALLVGPFSMAVEPAIVDEKPTVKEQIFKVTGMHCEDCVKTTTEAICKPGKYADCKVLLIDEKKMLGEVRITPNPGQIVSKKELSTALKDTGYKLAK